MKVPTRLAVIVSVAALVGALVSAPQVAAQATNAVPAATLTLVNVPGTSPMSATAVDLAAAGYTAREFYAEGLANRYTERRQHFHDRYRLVRRHPYRTDDCAKP